MMIEINLLPKDLKRSRISFKLDKKLVMALSGCIALLGVMAIYSFFFQTRTLTTLQKQLAISKAETTKYATEITKIDEISRKKEQILARMTAIQKLDKNREYWVSLLEDLAPRVPEYVWLTGIKQGAVTAPPGTAPAAPKTAAKAAAPSTAQSVQGGASKSSIEGYSFSLNALATFLVRLKKSDYFDNIEINSIKLQQIEKAEAYNFKLNCDLVTPVVDNLDVQTAQAPGDIRYQF
jgi:Tfp pilus assembly protein PilN